MREMDSLSLSLYLLRFGFGLCECLRFVVRLLVVLVLLFLLGFPFLASFSLG